MITTPETIQAGCVHCNNCGGPKAADGFKACFGCRAEWRRHGRKPGGPAETIEALREEVFRLRARVAKLEALHD